MAGRSSFDVVPLNSAKRNLFAKGYPSEGSWREAPERFGLQGLASECETERFGQQKLRADVKRRGLGRFYFLSRLSLLVAHRVPTVWNACTSSTSRMTQTTMMLVW